MLEHIWRDIWDFPLPKYVPIGCLFIQAQTTYNYVGSSSPVVVVGVTACELQKWHP